MIHGIKGKKPIVGEGAFIAWNAEVAGDVQLGAGASVWYSATLRADIAPIRVGKGSNIQDGAVLHVDHDIPCEVGEDCTVGHGAILHSCKVGSGSMVGMGAILLSGATIGEECVVGAGALVTEGKSFPPRSLIVGSPARCIRTISDEDAKRVRGNALTYRELARAAIEDNKE